MKKLMVIGSLLKLLFGTVRIPFVKVRRRKRKPINLTSSITKLSRIDLIGGTQLNKYSLDYPMFMREIAIMPQPNKSKVNKILSPLGVSDWIYMRSYHKYYSQ